MDSSRDFFPFHNTSLLNTTESILYVADESANDTRSTRPILSNEEYEYFAFICFNFVIPCICLCGFVGNFMAVGVLYRTAIQLKQSIYIYMCALTTADTTFMFISILRSIVVISKYINIKFHNFIYYHTNAALIFFDLSLTAISALMLILMSTERFIAIRYPLSVKTTLIAKKPFWFIITIWVAVFLIALPLPFLIKVTEELTSDNQTIAKTTIKPEMAGVFEYYVPIETIILNYLPFVAVLALNIAIPIQYRTAIKKRNSTMGGSSVLLANNLRVVGTVFVVSLMYTLLSLPQISIQTLSFVDSRFSIGGSEENMFWFLLDITTILLNLNMSIDFVIYILMSRVYRQRFLDMFCRKSKPADEQNVYSVTATTSS